MSPIAVPSSEASTSPPMPVLSRRRNAATVANAANTPVVVGGVTVIPGDYVYADSAAAVIIPATAIRKALEEAARIESDDAKYIEQIKQENAQDILRRGSKEQ